MCLSYVKGTTIGCSQAYILNFVNRTTYVSETLNPSISESGPDIVRTVQKKKRPAYAIKRFHDLNVLVLIVNYGICQQVATVQSLFLLRDLWMFLHHQPTDVGEKETTLGVVRVGIGISEFVVGPVGPGPVVDALLSDRINRKSSQSNRHRLKV